MTYSTRAVVPPNGFLPYGGHPDCFLVILPIFPCGSPQTLLRRHASSYRRGIGEGGAAQLGPSEFEFGYEPFVLLRLGGEGEGEGEANGRSSYVPATSPAGFGSVFLVRHGGLLNSSYLTSDLIPFFAFGIHTMSSCVSFVA
ncbi:hypothetical protein C8F01DRAFT_1261822 [Mycena amicta]|nr:hypothetical protein C8F01DRAFT_1261822 [Mycena amicta]